MGSKSVQDVFAPLIQDLDKMCNIRNKKFERLHGLILYRNLKRYAYQIETKIADHEPTCRIEKQLKRMLPRISQTLKELDSVFREDLYMFDMFQLIYRIIYSAIPFRAEKQEQLDYLFGQVWAVAKSKNPKLNLEKLTSFIPSPSSSCSDILGEWGRLWNSYLPGLFSYYDFPKTIQTNVAQEAKRLKKSYYLFLYGNSCALYKGIRVISINPPATRNISAGGIYPGILSITIGVP